MISACSSTFRFTVMHFIISVSKEVIYLPRFLFCLLHLMNNDKVMEASSALYFRDHCTPIEIAANPQKHWTLLLCIVAISKPYSEALRSTEAQGQVYHKIILSASSEMPTQYVNVTTQNTCTMLTTLLTSQHDHGGYLCGN